MTLYEVWPYHRTSPARVATVKAHHPSEAAARFAREHGDAEVTLCVLEQGAPASAVRTYETTRELVPYYRTREL